MSITAASLKKDPIVPTLNDDFSKIIFAALMIGAMGVTELAVGASIALQQISETAKNPKSETSLPIKKGCNSPDTLSDTLSKITEIYLKIIEKEIAKDSNQK